MVMREVCNMFTQMIVVFIFGAVTVLGFCFPAQSKAPENVSGRQEFCGSIVSPNVTADRLYSQNKRNYNNLSPRERDMLNRKIEKWKSLPPEKRNLLRRRMYQYKDLPPKERQLYRKRFDQLRNLPPKERQNLRKKLREWKSLPPQEREKIRRRFRPPEQ